MGKIILTALREYWGYAFLLIVMCTFNGVFCMSDTPTWVAGIAGFVTGIVIVSGATSVTRDMRLFKGTAVVVLSILFLGGAQIAGMLLAR